MIFNQENIGITEWSNLKTNPLMFASTKMHENYESLFINKFNPINRNNPFENICIIPLESQTSCLSFNNNEKQILGVGSIDGNLSLVDPLILKESNFIFGKNDSDLMNDIIEKSFFFNCQISDNQTSINAIEFNDFKTNIIAAACENICILNMETEEPEITCPNIKKNSGSYFTSLSWNKNQNVSHILATITDAGEMIILDLRKKESIFSMNDKLDIENRNCKVEWNPQSSVHLACTFDNPNSSVIQIWDLRNKKLPFAELEGFSNSSLQGLSWSLENSNNILTYDNNGNIIEFNYKTQEKTIFDTENEIVKAKYTNSMKNTFYYINKNGDLTLNSNEDLTHLKRISAYDKSNTNEETVVLNSYENQNSLLIQNDNNEEIELNKFDLILKKNEMSDLIKEYNSIFENKNFDDNDIIEFLKNKKDEKEIIYEFLEKENNNDILEILGFDNELILKESEKITGFKYSEVNLKENNYKEFSNLEGEDAANFFENLDEKETNNYNEKQDLGNSPENIVEIVKQKNINWDSKTEYLIKNNILMNNLTAAIDCCLSAERYLEAFMIAMSSPNKNELINNLIDKCSKFNDELFIKNFISKLGKNDTISILTDYDINFWKEMLVYIIKNDNNNMNSINFVIDRVNKELKNSNVVIYIYLLFQRYNDAINYILNLENENEFEKLLLVNFIINKYDFKINNNQIDELLIKCMNYLKDLRLFKFGYYLMNSVGNDNNIEILTFKNKFFYSLEETNKILFLKPNNLCIRKIDFKNINKTTSVKNNNKIFKKNNEDIFKPQFNNMPKPPVGNMPKSQVNNMPKPPVGTMPKPQFNNMPKPQFNNMPKPPVGTMPKPQVSNMPKPQVNNMPKPQVNNMPKPQVNNIPKPQVSNMPKPPVGTMPKPPTILKQPSLQKSNQTIPSQKNIVKEETKPINIPKPPINKKTPVAIPRPQIDLKSKIPVPKKIETNQIENEVNHKPQINIPPPKVNKIIPPKPSGGVPPRKMNNPPPISSKQNLPPSSKSIKNEISQNDLEDILMFLDFCISNGIIDIESNTMKSNKMIISAKNLKSNVEKLSLDSNSLDLLLNSILHVKNENINEALNIIKTLKSKTPAQDKEWILWLEKVISNMV